MDTSQTFKNGKINPDHVYELFGSFNGLSAEDVRMNLLGYVGDNIDFFECRSTVCLAMWGIGLNTCVDTIYDNCMCCDQLALLGLSAMYQRHCLVVTKDKFWSTIETKEPLSIIALMRECTVRLLYLGNLKFVTLHWKPRNPQPVHPRPNLGQFNIIEEYTLDEPSTSGEGSTTDNGDMVQVEMSAPQASTQLALKHEEKPTVSNRPDVATDVGVTVKSSETHPLRVETTDTNEPVKVGTSQK